MDILKQFELMKKALDGVKGGALTIEQLKFYRENGFHHESVKIRKKEEKK